MNCGSLSTPLGFSPFTNAGFIALRNKKKNPTTPTVTSHECAVELFLHGYWIKIHHQLTDM